MNAVRRALLAIAPLLAITSCTAGMATTSAISTAPQASVSPAAAAHAAQLLAALPERPEDTGAHYDRDDWGGWSSSHGCTIREALLFEQGTGVVRRADCRVGCPPVAAPCWHSPYDGLATGYARDLQVDHVVALKEAAVSGARTWTRDQRVAFHNDRQNLVLASARSNESKGERDAARWRPEQPYQCAYALVVADVKSRYGLAVDPAEKAALVAMLRTCP